MATFLSYFCVLHNYMLSACTIRDISPLTIKLPWLATTPVETCELHSIKKPKFTKKTVCCMNWLSQLLKAAEFIRFCATSAAKKQWKGCRITLQFFHCSLSTIDEGSHGWFCCNKTLKEPQKRSSEVCAITTEPQLKSGEHHRWLRVSNPCAFTWTTRSMLEQHILTKIALWP